MEKKLLYGSHTKSLKVTVLQKTQVKTFNKGNNMPNETIVHRVSELELVGWFNQKASLKLIQALQDVKIIDKVESCLNDKGKDYVAFKIDCVEVCRKPGY